MTGAANRRHWLAWLLAQIRAHGLEKLPTHPGVIADIVHELYKVKRDLPDLSGRDQLDLGCGIRRS